MTDRSEPTVLGPDDPTAKRLGWTMQELQGVTVYKLDDDFRCGTGQNTIKKDEIQVGMEIAIPAMRGYFVGKVAQNEYGEFYANVLHWRAVLEVAQDERDCWVSIALINMRGIAKLTDGLKVG